MCQATSLSISFFEGHLAICAICITSEAGNLTRRSMISIQVIFKIVMYLTNHATNSIQLCSLDRSLDICVSAQLGHRGVDEPGAVGKSPVMSSCLAGNKQWTWRHLH